MQHHVGTSPLRHCLLLFLQLPWHHRTTAPPPPPNPTRCLSDDVFASHPPRIFSIMHRTMLFFPFPVPFPFIYFSFAAPLPRGQLFNCLACRISHAAVAALEKHFPISSCRSQSPSKCSAARVSWPVNASVWQRLSGQGKGNITCTRKVKADNSKIQIKRSKHRKRVIVNFLMHLNKITYKKRN